MNIILIILIILLLGGGYGFYGGNAGLGYGSGGPGLVLVIILVVVLLRAKALIRRSACGASCKPMALTKKDPQHAAVRLDGITAPYVLDGPIDGETFRAYVEQMLAPPLLPGDIIVMDNLASHKVRGVREAIEATGAEQLYLPSYSPDLNPIENLFAKIKAVLRTRAARSVEALWDGIGTAIETITPKDCANCFRYAGYD